MVCKVCNKRDTCIEICTYMENILSFSEVSQREFPFSDEALYPLLERFLEDKMAPWQDNHSALLPELERRLKSLSHRQRTIIELYFFEGLSKAEIARRLNLKESTVLVRLSRALDQLRKPSNKYRHPQSGSEPRPERLIATKS